MRVWLIDEKQPGSASTLEESLRQLQEQPGTDLILLGSSPFQPDLAGSMSRLAPDHLDVLIINERACPDGPWIQDVLSLELGMLVVTAAEHVERFRAVADARQLNFVPPAVDKETLWLTLLGVHAAQRREQRWMKQVAHIEKRLADRITVERAKGILVQRLKISEDEAYKRLRVLSRRQRRPIRDIAQSLLDSEYLFSAESNGAATQPEAQNQRQEEQT
jgi:AmiR/NasT family two-component response regulator